MTMRAYTLIIIIIMDIMNTSYQGHSPCDCYEYLFVILRSLALVILNACEESHPLNLRSFASLRMTTYANAQDDKLTLVLKNTNVALMMKYVPFSCLY